MTFVEAVSVGCLLAIVLLLFRGVECLIDIVDAIREWDRR